MIKALLSNLKLLVVFAFALHLNLICFAVNPIAKRNPVSLEKVESPRIESVRFERNEVPQFGLLEANINVEGNWRNPFDPEDVRVFAEITTPTRQVTVDAFYFQDYRLVGDSLLPTGKSQWKIRYTPAGKGAYSLRVIVKTKAGSDSSGSFAFTCTPGTSRGFIGQSKNNPHYFAFEDGTTFFPIGTNLVFPWRLPLGDARNKSDILLERFADAGANIVRSWFCMPHHCLECRVDQRSAHYGPGWMDLESAWMIDKTVDKASGLGIYLMCCLENQGNFKDFWPQSPYNKKNGGPIVKPEEFFTNPDAKRLFKMRLRYLVSRWGYSPTIFSWQLSNEVNSMPNFNPVVVAKWHKEMAEYIRSIDPNSHLVHTNLSRLNGIQEINQLPELDLISTNVYFQRDGALTSDWTSDFCNKFNKPFLLTEFGQAKYEGLPDGDPTGVLLNNTMWGQLMTGSSGAGLPWWWDSWIDEHDLYYQYRILSNFVAGVDFANTKWSPVDPVSFNYTDSEIKKTYGSTCIEQWRRNFQPEAETGDNPHVITVDADGTFDKRNRYMCQVFNQQNFPEWIAENKEAYGKRYFDVDWPTDGFVDLIIAEVSSTQTPMLHVLVDQQEVISHPLIAGDDLTLEDPGANYFRRFRFPVSKGQHRVMIDNSGDGFFTFALRLGKHRALQGPDLQVRGIQSDEQILLWLRNPEYNWLYDRVGIRPTRQHPGLLVLKEVLNGRYRARWIDTTGGNILLEEKVVAKNGLLLLSTPEINASAACRLERLP